MAGSKKSLQDHFICNILAYSCYLKDLRDVYVEAVTALQETSKGRIIEAKGWLPISLALITRTGELLEKNPEDNILVCHALKDILTWTENALLRANVLKLKGGRDGK